MRDLAAAAYSGLRLSAALPRVHEVDCRSRSSPARFSSGSSHRATASVVSGQLGLVPDKLSEVAPASPLNPDGEALIASPTPGTRL